MTRRGDAWFGLVAAVLLAYLGGSFAEEVRMTPGQQPFVHPLDTLDSLEVHAATARIVEDGGAKALELEGVALIPDLVVQDAGIEVEIYAPAPCYPGVVFRFTDLSAYELAYAVPAASGQCDAIQYDPVFNGSNTWQLHAGPAYQEQAHVPTGEWFTFRVDVVGERAAIRVGDQPPLVVERLSHDQVAGRVGLWTFRPARFRNLRVTTPRSFDDLSGEVPRPPDGAIDAWWLPGTGSLASEPSGVLNLNRYGLPPDREVRLSRSFEVDDDIDLEVAFGYSDGLRLTIDDELLFEGTHTFSGFDSLEARGWVRLEDNRLIHRIGAGRHQLEAALRLTERFGWGLIVGLGGGKAHLLPPEEATSKPTR